MLYVEPYGGLCNRMRCISSAYRYAKDNDCKLAIIWCELNELNCDFNSLFSFKDNIGIQVINIPYADARYFRRIIYRIVKWILKLLSKDVYDDLGIDNVPKDLNRAYVRSCGYWYPSNKPYEMFIPRPIIKDRVGSFVGKYENLIGVHIRRTDNIVSINDSPTDIFYPLIDKAISSYENSTIYVATDDEKEIDKIIKHYGPEKVAYLPEIERKRDKKAGIIDAAVELYILANCKVIIGSYYSSFTDTASEINGINKIIAKSTN